MNPLIPLRPLLAALFLLLSLALPRHAVAHGLSDVDGEMTITPVGAVAGEPLSIQVILRSSDPGALVAPAVVRARVIAGSEVRDIELVPSGPATYTASYVATEGHHDVRIHLERGEKREFAMSGFEVRPTLEAMTDIERELWFVPQGRFDALPWLDNLSGAGVALLALVALVRLLRAATGAPDAPAVPVFVLLIAAAGAVSMPFGAYWDIAFHSESGRESFWSAPHLLIYGGILLSLTALVAAMFATRSSRGLIATAWGSRPMRAAAIGMMLVLGSAPADELWHALFGLDVSVWSPPHAVLIGGATTALLGLAAIPASGPPPVVIAIRAAMLAASLLAFNVFLAESEFPVPAWHVSQLRPEWVFPVMLGLFASLVATVARRTLRCPYAGTLVVGTYLGLRLLVPVLLAGVGAQVMPRISVFIALPLVCGVAVDAWYLRRPGSAVRATTAGGHS